MKEFYIAPEVKRLGFLAQEEIAVSGSFDDLLNGDGSVIQPGGALGGLGSETEVDPGDIGVRF